MKIDLHIHSHLSDGEDSLDVLVPRVKASGVDVFALTDHDRTDGWDDASRLAKELGISFIPGVEITTEGRVIEDDGESRIFGIHLLAYLADSNNPVLEELLSANRESRLRRLIKFCDNLNHDFPALTADYVIKNAEPGATLGRPLIGRALVNLGICESVDLAFNSGGNEQGLIGKKQKYYVRNEAPDVIDVIQIVRNAGGVPVIAHPMAQVDSDDEQPVEFPRHHFEQMVKAGLLGLETNHTKVPAASKLIFEAFAAEHNLITTGSSDYHGLATKEGIEIGLRTTDPEMLKRIIAAGTGTAPTLSHQL